MTPRTFLHGALAGGLLSSGGAILFMALRPLLPYTPALNVTLAVVAAAYGIYLLVCSHVRSGRIAAFTLGLGGLALALWLISSSAMLIVVAGTGIWLLRACFFHQRPVHVLGDGLLIASGITAAWASAVHTNSLLLSLWAFFLIQSFFVYIAGFRSSVKNTGTSLRRFTRAYHQAEKAIRQINTTRPSKAV